MTPTTDIAHRPASVMRAMTGVPSKKLARSQRAQERYLAMVERAGVWLQQEMKDIWGDDAVETAITEAEELAS